MTTEDQEFKLDPAIKTKWVEALRSGKYKQADGCMQDGKGAMCCLGVLADVLDPEGWDETPNEIGLRAHRGLTGLPDRSLRELAGFQKSVYSDNRRIPSVQINGETTSLDMHNDNGKTFEQLAKAIEEQL